jgi:hypothetical protein
LSLPFFLNYVSLKRKKKKTFIPQEPKDIWVMCCSPTTKMLSQIIWSHYFYILNLMYKRMEVGKAMEKVTQVNDKEQKIGQNQQKSL